MSEDTYCFRLYVAGEAPNSRRASANLAAFCRQYLPDRHTIEIVDVFAEPNRALEDNVLMTPALKVTKPFPVSAIIGDLSEPEILKEALGL